MSLSTGMRSRILRATRQLPTSGGEGGAERPIEQRGPGSSAARLIPVLAAPHFLAAAATA